MSSRSLLSVRRRGLALCQVLSLSLVAMAAQAQTTTSAAPADPKAAAMSDVDRAKRDADKVFQWIRFHAEKGEKKAPEKAPEKHEAKVEPKPALKQVSAPAPATRRPELDPAAERALAARNAAQDAPVVAAAPTTSPAPIGQGGQGGVGAGGMPSTIAPTVAPPTTQPAPMSDTVSPQAMAAPATTASAGKTPPPEPDDEPAQLQLLRKVDPEYPRALLQQQRAGSVLVQFIVQPDGRTDAVQALRSPDRKLSAAAVKAVQQWKFAPITTARQVSVEIGFQVD